MKLTTAFIYVSQIPIEKRASLYASSIKRGDTVSPHDIFFDTSSEEVDLALARFKDIKLSVVQVPRDRVGHDSRIPDTVKERADVIYLVAQTAQELCIR